MEIKPNCCAIIVAAGKSTRMAGDISKQFIPILGVPTIIRTISAFESAKIIKSIVVVCRKKDMNIMNHYIKKYKLNKVTKIVKGGETRQQSVADGVSVTPDNTDYFVIHDGARPLITKEEINSSVEDGIKYNASTIAVPVKDTIKIIGNNNFVESTPKRSLIWAVQTPQVFERTLYLKALKQAKIEDTSYTDDCQLVEHIGIKVHLCRGTYTNIKLTTMEDVYFAESIVKCREELK